MFNKSPEIITINIIDNRLADLEGQRRALHRQHGYYHSAGIREKRDNIARQSVALRDWRERLAFDLELPPQYSLTRVLLNCHETIITEASEAP